MPAPDLKPQTPGEPLTDTAADPQAAKRAELEAIAALNAPEVIDGLATMTGDELALLREIEAGGKGRVTVLGAIDAALAPPKAAAGRDQAHADVSPELSVVVAGALFDFLGFLTSRDQVITAGASEDPSAVKEAVEEWAAARGLQLDEPAVADWQERGTELTSLQVGDQAAGAAGVGSGAGDPQPRHAVLTEQGWVVPAPEAKG